MKKRQLILFGILFIILILNNVLGASIPYSNTDQGNPSDYTNVNENAEIGGILGFDNNQDISAQNIRYRQTGEGIEVTLLAGGKIIGNVNEFTGDSSSEFIDLNKANKFVFNDGRIISAEFSVKSDIKSPISITLKQTDFRAPPGSKVILKDDKASVFIQKSYNDGIEEPGVGNIPVSYVTNGKDVLLALGKNVYAVLKEGEIKFSNNINGEIIFLGEKVVFGDFKTSNTFIDPEKTLSNMEIKNHDPDVGTSFFVGSKSNFEEINNPYITLKVSAEKAKWLTPCAIGVDRCGMPEGNVLSYTMGVYPDIQGNSPELTFRKGNALLPGMSSGQYVNINPGNQKMSLTTSFAVKDSKDVAYTTLSLFSENAVVNNNGGLIKLIQEDGKYQWSSSRTLQDANYYPMTLNAFEDKPNEVGVLTVNRDMITTGDKGYVNIVRSSLPEVSPPDEYGQLTPGERIKLKTIDVISGAMGKIFGGKMKFKTEDVLNRLFFGEKSSCKMGGGPC